MKILAIGDPHIKKSNIEEIDMLLVRIVGFVTQENPDCIVIMGDLSNDFEKIHISAYRTIRKFLTVLSSLRKTYCLIGNHDLINNQCFQTDEHFFTGFSDLSGLTVIDKATIIDMGGESVVMAPYVPCGRFEEALNSSGDIWKNSRVIFCHQEFFGAKMGAIKSRNGDKWPLNYPLVVSGHVHERDWLQKNILYVGIPYYGNFGDKGPKTIEIIEILDGEIKTSAHDLGMPKKITYRIDCDQFSNIKLNDNDRVRLHIKDTVENIKKLKKTKKYKELSSIHKIILLPTDETTTESFDKKKNFYDILKEYTKDDRVLVHELFNEIQELAGKL